MVFILEIDQLFAQFWFNPSASARRQMKEMPPLGVLYTDALDFDAKLHSRGAVASEFDAVYQLLFGPALFLVVVATAFSVLNRWCGDPQNRGLVIGITAVSGLVFCLYWSFRSELSSKQVGNLRTQAHNQVTRINPGDVST